MKKATFLLVVIVLLLSVFCTNAMAAGTDDGQVYVDKVNNAKFFVEEKTTWCTYYIAADGTDASFYRYSNVDLNQDTNTDVCDLVYLDVNKVDIDFDENFAAKDGERMRAILFGASDF